MWHLQETSFAKCGKKMRGKLGLATKIKGTIIKK